MSPPNVYGANGDAVLEAEAAIYARDLQSIATPAPSDSESECHSTHPVESDTPETDKWTHDPAKCGGQITMVSDTEGDWVPACFARDLERRLTDTRKLLATYSAERDMLNQIDEIMQTMRPRWCGSTVTMDGKYPCWIVWLPHEGTTSRKTLKQAILDFVAQSTTPTP